MGGGAGGESVVCVNERAIQTKEKNPVMDPSFNALFGLRKQSMMFKAGD